LHGSSLVSNDAQYLVAGCDLDGVREVICAAATEEAINARASPDTCNGVRSRPAIHGVLRRALDRQ
jgi:hypothetical protein